ncbi:MAG TPA: hypothetical protein VGN25_01065 [Solirubrobacteraceae bacterium]|nr:hypothetical protein [Solirubrobacteraceae bacterium]
MSRPQHHQALRVTGDPIDEPKRRRGRRDTPKQRLLIAEHPKVSQTVSAISEHHRQVTNHTTLIVPRTPLLQARKPADNAPVSPVLSATQASKALPA